MWEDMDRHVCTVHMDRHVCAVHTQVTTGDKNRQGNINKHTGQRVRGEEDTAQETLRPLNYLPNDDVKSEHFQY